MNVSSGSARRLQVSKRQLRRNKFQRGTKIMDLSRQTAWVSVKAYIVEWFEPEYLIWERAGK